jgi:hypothetical protein
METRLRASEVLQNAEIATGLPELAGSASGYEEASISGSAGGIRRPGGTADMYVSWHAPSIEQSYG